MNIKKINRFMIIYYIIIGLILFNYKEITNITTKIYNDLEYVKCGSATEIPKAVPQVTSIAYTLIIVGTPIILIIFSIVTMIKALGNGNGEEIQKAKNNLFKKLIIAAIIFFIGAIVQFVINKVTSNDNDKTTAMSCMKCFLYYSSNNCTIMKKEEDNNDIRKKTGYTSNYLNSNVVQKSNKKKNKKSNTIITNDKSGWITGTYGKLKYLLYTPPKVYSNKPLIVQLHGGAECGKNYDVFDKFGYKYKTDNGSEINAYILMPILPVYTSWINYDQDLFGLIEKVVDEKGIDKNRITLSGISLGANGVPQVINKHPGYFANAILYAIGYEPNASIFKDVNTWIVWGDKDNGAGSYSSTHSPNLYNSIQKAGYNVKKTMYPGIGHDSIIISKIIDDPDFDNFITQSKDGSTDKGKVINNSSSGWVNGKYGKLEYTLYVPPKVLSTKPLVVYLHGRDEFKSLGGNLNKLFAYGYGRKINSGMDFNAYVLMPLGATYSWGNHYTEVMELIKKIVADYKLDSNRVTLTGFSAGAWAIPDLLKTNPGYFSNVIIYAIGTSSSTSLYKDVHTWIVWGEADTSTTTYSTKLYNDLKYVGYSVRKDSYPGIRHNGIIIDKNIEKSDFFNFINQPKK